VQQIRGQYGSDVEKGAERCTFTLFASWVSLAVSYRRGGGAYQGEFLFHCMEIRWPLVEN